MRTYWPAPAKLNLFLYITGQRSDGYHTLQTLFQFIDYSDIIFIKKRNDGQIHFLSQIDGVRKENNLIVNAARMLLVYSTTINGRIFACSGADIAVKKNLPLGAGLGGASSDVATVLIALNYIWNCGFSQDELAAIGLQFGADVPVFIYGHAAFAEGIGEILTPIDLKEKWYLVVYPGINVSTSLVFQDPGLLNNSPVRSIDSLLKCEFTNDCEITVRKRFHEVDAALSWLLEYAPARLTGTGSCIFAEFDTQFAAYQVLEHTPNCWKAFVARGMNTTPLQRAILASRCL